MSTHRQKEHKRPLSPHLQVYKFQITSVTSALNRITGIVSFLGLSLILWFLCTAVLSPESFFYHTCHLFFNSKLGKAFLFAWSFSTIYHSINGIRHLFWNFGKGFGCYNATGIIAIVSSIICTILIWILIWEGINV